MGFNDYEPLGECSEEHDLIPASYKVTLQLAA